MISRTTAKAIADLYEAAFTFTGRHTGTTVYSDRLYEFLYERDYPAWLCNMAKQLKYKRNILEWVMRLHTGESLTKATPSWSWEDRQRLGQRYLEGFAEDILPYARAAETYPSNRYKAAIESAERGLELDGYQFRDGLLLRPETDALDAQEAQGVIHALYDKLKLGDRETAFHHLGLSEEHYLNSRWDDCISNARKFLECTLAQVANVHSTCLTGSGLPTTTLERPVAVRDYLEAEKLLETKEKEALSKVYGLLSHTGGHPYMAENDQARLLRHLALTFAQFVMLRLQGKLKSGKQS